MSLVTSKEMLLKAQREGYAVGAFNVENMEMVQAVIAAAEELKAPVILQTTAGTLKYAEPSMYSAMAAAAAAKANVPVVMHFDHGDSFERSAQVLYAGYTSVMIDGSKEIFEKNIEMTGRVVEMAHAMGIPVEAELGTVGGKEDGHQVSDKEKNYTDPQEAEEFAKRTDIDSLAVGIGNSHGFYKGRPDLRFHILEETRKRVTVPIVLHGASGIPEEDVKKAVRLGICKVNFATELRAAYSAGVKLYITSDSDVIDPKKYSESGRDAVKRLVAEKIKMCGSDGKA